jgi:hypothetical protein
MSTLILPAYQLGEQLLETVAMHLLAMVLIILDGTERKLMFSAIAVLFLFLVHIQTLLCRHQFASGILVDETTRATGTVQTAVLVLRILRCRSLSFVSKSTPSLVKRWPHLGGRMSDVMLHASHVSTELITCRQTHPLLDLGLELLGAK